METEQPIPRSERSAAYALPDRNLAIISGMPRSKLPIGQEADKRSQWHTAAGLGLENMITVLSQMRIGFAVGSSIPDPRQFAKVAASRGLGR